MNCQESSKHFNTVTTQAEKGDDGFPAYRCLCGHLFQVDDIDHGGTAVVPDHVPPVKRPPRGPLWFLRSWRQA